MCVVSAVGNDWSRRDQWPNWPAVIPFPDRQYPVGPTGITNVSNTISRKEFEDLRSMVLELKKQLEAARAQDIADGNPDCEMEDKVIILKKIADMFGVDLSGVFPNAKPS